MDTGKLSRVLASIFSFIAFCIVASAAFPGESKYEFTTDWTTPYAEDWSKALAEFKGKANVHGLEVGSFEGRSSIWFLDHILTGPNSTLTCIDVFLDSGLTKGAERRFDRNIEASGHANKLKKVKGWSHPSLRALPTDYYDFIYIDGCHDAPCVLLDIMLSWDLLKSGGVLIFDDYGYFPTRPKLEKPTVSIDAFTEIFQEKIELLHEGYQLIVRKK